MRLDSRSGPDGYARFWFVSDPIGSAREAANEVNEWNNKLGTNGNPGTERAGVFCVLTGICDIVEKIGKGDYYGAGYDTGQLDVDATVALASASVGGAAGAGTRAGRVLTKLGRTGCSFTSATLVLMADRTTKPIAAIEPNDEVIATDPDSATTAPRLVTALHINQDHDLTDLTIQTPGEPQSTIHTTQNHPFWDVTAQEWVPAGQLEPGHLLTTPRRHKRNSRPHQQLRGPAGDVQPHHSRHPHVLCGSRGHTRPRPQL